MKKKPNHICRYSGCTLGEDGGQKHYYACNFCDKTQSYLAVACCREHYDLYIKEILAAREAEKIDLEPKRTDMTQEEVKTMKKKSVKSIKKETEKDLKDYADKDGKVNIAKAVEKINKENG